MPIDLTNLPNDCQTPHSVLYIITPSCLGQLAVGR